ncbi:MAG: RES family NAD+ phosphorylase [Spongiibacteraceae bacterium]|nr:RES family NAD+ phosphorylase [Spongiibacteraceae bacterium]
MLQDFFSGLATLAHRQRTYRNIVSLRASRDLFDDLSDDPGDRAIAAAVELAHKPPTYHAAQPVISRPFEEAAWSAAIGFPFVHWTRSRYSDGSFGVWYGGDSVATTVHETAWHWRNGLLSDAEGFLRPGISMERSVYTVMLDAVLIDLRDAVDTWPALIDPDDYGFTQQVGQRFHQQGLPGLITRSARCSGDSVAIFQPAVLSAPRQHCYLTYRTTATGVEVERKPGTVWLRLRYS